MNKTIEKLNSLGYTLEQTEEDYLRKFKKLQLVSPDGKRTDVLLFHENIYIGCRNIEKAKEKIENGEAIKTNGSELYRAYYLPDGTDDDWDYFWKYDYRMSRKSYDAIMSAFRATGAIYYDRTENYRNTDFVNGTVKNYDGALNSNKVTVGQLLDGTWQGEFYVGFIDTACKHSIVFKKEPSIETFWRAHDTIEILFGIGLKFQESYRCFECGRVSFWLDSSDDIVKAAEYAENRYCGC